MLRYEITIPAACGDGALEHVRLSLIARFGGYTETTARGGWRADSGERVIESVHVFATDAPIEREPFMAHLDHQWIIDLASHVAKVTGEAAGYVVRYPVDGGEVRPERKS